MTAEAAVLMKGPPRIARRKAVQYGAVGETVRLENKRTLFGFPFKNGKRNIRNSNFEFYFRSFSYSKLLRNSSGFEFEFVLCVWRIWEKNI